jgi:hypothetical protein
MPSFQTISTLNFGGNITSYNFATKAHCVQDIDDVNPLSCRASP